MTANEKKFAVSINAGIIDKPDDRRNHGKGWDPFELSAPQVEETIRLGLPIAPQYGGGHRKSGNFIKSGFLAADVDHGMTVEEAENHAFVRQHACLIHTTASHTEARHRFRIVFLLDEAIVTARDWADALLGLALLLDSDRSATDAARLFYGNSRAELFSIGKTVSPPVVANLVASGRDARASRSPLDGRRLPVDSARQIAGPELIKVAGGAQVRMDELGVGTAIHCPHHADDDPSAFTVRSGSGQLGIHCSACRATFWSSAEGDDYDFKGFDRICHEKLAEVVQSDVEPEGIDRFFPPAPSIIRHQQAFLPPFTYFGGITLVKSNKGTGKTEALKALLADIRAGRYLSSTEPRDRIKSVLLIGNRQSLIREAAAKLSFHCYLDGDETDGGMRTLAVCLDSLPKYIEARGARRPKPFDLVIIDESEQVIAHLLSETIKKRAGIERCFDSLLHVIANAKAVTALDADLGLVTAHGMMAMRPQDWRSRCRIIVNDPVAAVAGKTTRLHRDRKFLELEVIAAVKRGERCFITSNSKDYIDTIHRMIRNECGDGIVMRVITKDNSRDEDTVRFLKDIKTRILTVQVLLGSPSIGTGIDITFPDGACRVDRVFGFFFSFINAHTDIDQQLCRVRNPGAVDVWIAPATFRFTSNVEVIMDDLARAYTVKRAVLGLRKEDGMVDYDRNNPLLLICAHVTALRRASMNRLVELFCELRQHNGWTIEHVSQTAENSPFQAAKKVRRAERIEKLLNAPKLPDADFNELEARESKGANLSKEERFAYEKNHFERTVGVGLDPELVEMNADGRLIEKIAALAKILSLWSINPEGFDNLLKPTLQPNGRLSSMIPETLVGVILRAAGLTTTEGFNADATVSVETLARFVAICRDNRTVIEEIMAEPLVRDFQTKPVSQLSRFLRRVGLKLAVVQIEKVAGKKVRRYGIPVSQRDRMTTLAQSYLEAESRRERAKEASLRRRNRSEAGRHSDAGTKGSNNPAVGAIEAIIDGGE
jgi:Origin of replication binding protein